MSVFYSRNVWVQTKIYHFVYSYIAQVASPSCLHHDDQFIVFFLYFSHHEEHEDMPLSQ